jgi:hypothetical protein
MLLYPGSPTRLRELAQTWHTEVGGPVSGISSNADPNQTTIQLYWEGEAVDAYLTTLPPQRIAMEKIKTGFVDPATTAMTNMATAIEGFWQYALVLLALLLAEVVAAIIAAKTSGPFALALVSEPAQ